MNPDSRTELLAGVRSALPVYVGLVPFALVTGVAGSTAGLTPWQTIGLSLIVFSGIAQLIVTQLLAVSSPALVILITAGVVSLRLVMYSAALAPHMAALPPRWKLVISYLLTDQGFAALVNHYNSGNRQSDGRWFGLGVGLGQWIPWQITVAIGALIGTQVPAAWSLDFAVTLSFLAMLVPTLRDPSSRIAALTGGIATVLALDLPLRLGLIVACLAGIVAGSAASAIGSRRILR